MVVVAMTPSVPNLYPAVALKFLDDLSNLHTSQRLRQFRDERGKVKVCLANYLLGKNGTHLSIGR
jgi:hypothetical protein